MKTAKGRVKQGDNEVPREKPPHSSTIDVDPANVKHNYMHFLVKRSYSPENAIYAIDVDRRTSYFLSWTTDASILYLRCNEHLKLLMLGSS